MFQVRNKGIFFFCLSLALHAGEQQDLRAQGLDTLKIVRRDVEQHYFDPAYGHEPMDQAWCEAESRMRSAQTVGHTFGIIAQALAALNDSHTFFVPPVRTNQVRLGWTMTMVGSRCLVTKVTTDSDAEHQGLHVGDEILALEGFAPTRGSLWKMRYLYETLQPRSSLSLTVRGPSGSLRKLEVKSEIRPGRPVLQTASGFDAYYDLLREQEAEQQLDPHRMHAVGPDAIVCRMPDFLLSPHAIDSFCARMRNHASIVLDLRGNQGGSVDALQFVAGHLLGKEVLLATRHGRKPLKPIKSRAAGKPTLTAPLIILVDSASASAAEILARSVQLEHRGRILGDVTSGSVRQSRLITERWSLDPLIEFSISITDAGLLMKDGQSLEHRGVQPDEIILPTPLDLAAGRDPVLAGALTLLGIPTTPEAAGRMLPVRRRPS